MHRRLGSATLSQLAFPREGNPKFPGKKSHWENTVVKSVKRKKKKKKSPEGPSAFTYPLTAGVVGAPQMTSQPVCSIFFLFSSALWDLANSRPVHSLMLSSLLFCCLPCLLPPFTVPCKMVLATLDERETCPYHLSLRLFTMVRRFSCGPIAC